MKDELDKRSTHGYTNAMQQGGHAYAKQTVHGSQHTTTISTQTIQGSKYHLLHEEINVLIDDSLVDGIGLAEQLEEMVRLLEHFHALVICEVHRQVQDFNLFICRYKGVKRGKHREGY